MPAPPPPVIATLAAPVSWAEGEEVEGETKEGEESTLAVPGTGSREARETLMRRS